MLTLDLNFIANLIMPERNDHTPEDEEQAEVVVESDGDKQESPFSKPSPTLLDTDGSQAGDMMRQVFGIPAKPKDKEE